ncbi:MAG: ABC transporter ATP-binding protein [Pseudomonadota bacterium]
MTPSADPSAPELSLTAVAKTFDGVTAVRDLGLSVHRGEFVCLLGPSGCGKTTTLRMVGGLERATSGTIRLGGRLVDGPNAFVPPEARDLGMVFQSYALWPHLTVAENIAYALKLRRRPAAEIAVRVDKLLKLVDLTNLGGRYPSQLSGGQQQRVALARALATDPGLVLFDEPLSNLDATLRESMRLELRNMHQRTGFTAVYVTHSQQEAFALGSRIVIMKDGAIEQISGPRELYAKPNTAFVASFVGVANLLALAEGAHANGRVRLADGLELTAEGSHDAPTVAMIRPENIEVAPRHSAGTAPQNAFVGTVCDVVFAGPTADCFVSVADTVLRSQVPSADCPAVGTEVDLTIAPRNVRLLAH